MNLYDLVEMVASGMIERVEISPDQRDASFIYVRILCRLPNGEKLPYNYGLHNSVPKLGERSLRERLMKETMDSFFAGIKGQWERHLEEIGKQEVPKEYLNDTEEQGQE